MIPRDPNDLESRSPGSMSPVGDEFNSRPAGSMSPVGGGGHHHGGHHHGGHRGGRGFGGWYGYGPMCDPLYDPFCYDPLVGGDATIACDLQLASDPYVLGDL